MNHVMIVNEVFSVVGNRNAVQECLMSIFVYLYICIVYKHESFIKQPLQLSNVQLFNC